MTEEKALPEFSVGQFVYYDKGSDIGKITNVTKSKDGSWNYRIDYCQFKDPDRGTSGGNGPVFREGFPKPVTNPADVLFVAAMNEAQTIRRLKAELKNAESNYSALKIARKIISP